MRKVDWQSNNNGKNHYSILGFAHRYSEASCNRLARGLEAFNDESDGNDKYVVMTGGDTTGCGEVS